jgi:ABC-type sugar transport system permease subunit
MSEKSQVMDQTVAFDRSVLPPVRYFRLPSLPMTVLLLVVGFLVLTPLALMILNSFQIARPGQPIVWGLEGWVKAFSTPGIIKAITNTFTLAITRQVIALFIGAFFAWLIARTDLPIMGLLEFFFWLSFFLLALPETMGWILLLDPKYGLLNQGLIGLGIINQPLFNIYSFWGIVWAHMGHGEHKVMLRQPFAISTRRWKNLPVSQARVVGYSFSHPHSSNDAGDPCNYDSRHHSCPRGL